MGDALIYQPFEHTINRDTIHRVVIGKHCRNIKMRSRMLTRKQAGKDCHARLRESLAGVANDGFGGGKMGEIGGLHGQSHLTLPRRQLQLSSMKINDKTLAMVGILEVFRPVMPVSARVCLLRHKPQRMHRLTRQQTSRFSR